VLQGVVSGAGSQGEQPADLAAVLFIVHGFLRAKKKPHRPKPMGHAV
jgi:hypothetical protein